ncbi:MAG: diguanylate cyclase [Desulfuromonadaceae bacterium]|nr:diguanylate cyclase [Desulfuromonadaceae bacterium]
MSLKNRILFLASFLVVVASLASWLAYQSLSKDIVERWGRQVAEIQVRYDSARLLQSLEREIALSRQMADSLTLINWAKNPSDQKLRAEAIRQMESFRSNFRNKSYFVALRQNRHYYYNNAANEFAGNQFRYVLDPDKAEDAWFFQLIEEGRDFHLNVNPDVELGVTKLWIDILMRDDDGKIVGMVGTGLDLDAFLQNIVDIGQDGITTLFVDFNGAIQLYRDRNYIDFASIIKPEGQKNTIDLLFESPEDKQAILNMLHTLKQGDGKVSEVESRFVTVEGRKQLAGVAFLPTIGWFEVTLLDLETLLPVRHLWPLSGIFIATLLITLVVFHLLIRKRVLQPIIDLEAAVKKVRNGDFQPPVLPKSDNEIGRLMGHFEEMAATLKESTADLQRQVEERTRDLHRLARVDSLTELRNRRGLDELLYAEIQRANRQHLGFGILWMDIDHFKAINDRLGHQMGDAVLRNVAHWLRTCLRPYDIAGRWGGDEFVVILSPCDQEILARIAQRIRSCVESQSREMNAAVTVSIGGYVTQPGDKLDTILQHVDQALYRAKEEGRNRVWI